MFKNKSSTLGINTKLSFVLSMKLYASLNSIHKSLTTRQSWRMRNKQKNNSNEHQNEINAD